MTSLPVARSDVTSLHADQSDMTSQTTSITDQRDTPLTTSSVQTVVTCPDQLTQPPPVEISGSPIAETCLRPIASRPNSGNNRGNRLCDDNNNLTVPGNNLSYHGIITFKLNTKMLQFESDIF